MNKRVRGVLLWEGQALLANHRYVPCSFRHRWSLPGGHVEPTDPSLEAALRRELWEEFCLNPPGTFCYLGAWPWGGAIHHVFAISINLNDPKIDFDKNEIRRVNWFSLDEIKILKSRGGLHTGFEYFAVKTAISKLNLRRKEVRP
jgi:8-oxo-dGTP pyrophosphatase MutT (NUDIX family)